MRLVPRAPHPHHCTGYNTVALAPTRLVLYGKTVVDLYRTVRASGHRQDAKSSPDPPNSGTARQIPHRGEYRPMCMSLETHSGMAGYTSSTGHGNSVRSMKRNAEPAAICRVKPTPVYSFVVGKSGARWKKMTSRPK